MSPNDQPRRDDALAPPALDVAAVGKVVREELDRQNKYLEFAQGQIEKDIDQQPCGNEIIPGIQRREKVSRPDQALQFHSDLSSESAWSPDRF